MSGGYFNYKDSHIDQIAEIERLREELRVSRQSTTILIKSLDEEIERLRENAKQDAANRIEKLEAALRHYVCACVIPNCEVASLDSCICGLTARQALEEKE